MSLGENIQTFRKLKKLSRENLGKLIGRSQFTIKKYELNEVVPSLDIIQKISEALNIETWDLLIGSPDGKTAKEYRKDSVEKMLDDFKLLLIRIGYVLSDYGDKYILSSTEAGDEIIINKDELIDIHDAAMDYVKFTVDKSYNKLNDDKHKSTLEEINIVDEITKED